MNNELSRQHSTFIDLAASQGIGASASEHIILDPLHEAVS
jgi:hypothetical protein